MATEWTDALGQVWEIKDGNQNFDEWVAGFKKDEFDAACEKWHTGDKADLEALFATWFQSTEATKK